MLEEAMHPWSTTETVSTTPHSLTPLLTVACLRSMRIASGLHDAANIPLLASDHYGASEFGVSCHLLSFLLKRASSTFNRVRNFT